MKKIVLLFGAIFLATNCFAQITFEKGYYINNQNKKIDCFIKNLDWRNNPTEIKIKLLDSDKIQDRSIKQIKEFGIYDESKYLRVTVDIDRSSQKINNLSEDRRAIFKEEQLFLKVLVEGKASLYSYKDLGLTRFFYSVDKSKIEQLIYKSYILPSNKIGKNTRFRNQLSKSLVCNQINTKKLKRLTYKEKSLVDLFLKYNKCNNASFVNYRKDKKRDLLNVTPRVHFNNTFFSVVNPFSSNSVFNIDFGSNFSFGFGVEAEYILPFNKNKWSIIVEPMYQRFNKQIIKDASTLAGGKLITEMDYRSIEVPIGIRHYFFLNNKSSLFVNASYILGLSVAKSNINFKRVDGSIVNDGLNFEPQNGFGVGVGYKLDNYSLELRYTTKDVLENWVNLRSDFETLSIVLGYTLF